MGNTCYTMFLYADELDLIAESENDLQKMLEVVHDWFKKWCM